MTTILDHSMSNDLERSKFPPGRLIFPLERSTQTGNI
jgi:hypothetical protein